MRLLDARLRGHDAPLVRPSFQRGGGDAAELGAGDAGNRLHRSGRFVTLASGLDSDNDALPIRAYARVLGATVKKGETLEYKLGAKRHGYLVPAVGTVEVNGVQAGTRDGVAIEKEEKVTVTALEDAEIVMVDSV